MTVLPVFVAGHDHDGQMVQAGSCLLLSPVLALTCDHVTRAHRRCDGDELSKADIAVGVAHHRVAAITRSSGDAEDLALITLERQQPFTAVAFSRQWQLDRLHAYGFSCPPFGEVENEGPIALDERALRMRHPRRISFAFGLADGFSGGPMIGTFGGTRYCVGLNQLGGTGKAISVMVSAAACAAFVEQHVASACALTDLGAEAFLRFVTDEWTRVERVLRDDPRLPLLVSGDAFEIAERPLVRIETINRRARHSLRRGSMPVDVVLPVPARELELFLVTEGRHRDADQILRSFFQQRRMSPVAMDAFTRLMDSGSIVVAILEYQAPDPDHRHEPLSEFLVALRRHLAGRRAACRHR